MIVEVVHEQALTGIHQHLESGNHLSVNSTAAESRPLELGVQGAG